MLKTIQQKLLSHKDVSRLLGVHRCTLHRWRSTGLIPDPIYISGLPRWRPDEIHAWLDAGAPSARKWAQIKKKVGDNDFQKMRRFFENRAR